MTGLEDTFRTVLAARLPDDPKWAAWIDGTVQELAAATPPQGLDRDANNVEAWEAFRDSPGYQPTDRYDARVPFDAGWNAALAVAEPAYVDLDPPGKGIWVSTEEAALIVGIARTAARHTPSTSEYLSLLAVAARLEAAQ